MHTLERLALRLRHHPTLRQATWLWDGLRPMYDRAVAVASPRGISRRFNNSDTVRLLSRYRPMGEQYEPEVWRAVMEAIRPGDTVADVGAFIGLYTIAIGNRVGPHGHVVAFEPAPDSMAILRAHIALNRLGDRVEAQQLALGVEDATVAFAIAEQSAAIAPRATPDTVSVRCVRLDSFWGERPLDVLKLDVEGYEEQVLRGAAGLLARSKPPRAIFVEVHPYAWGAVGTSSASLLGLLAGHGYRIEDVAGRPVAAIDGYGEIVARRA